ncbi:hypothetical protein ACTFIT_001672 [Dictyostelium discoideum]
MVSVCQVERNDVENLDKELFYSYIKSNKPVVFEKYRSQAIEKWTPDYLLSIIGDREVHVNMCTFGSMSDIVPMKFSEYLNKTLKNEFPINDSNGERIKKINKPYLRNFGMLDEFPILKEDVKNNESIFNKDVHNMVVMGSFIGCKDSATNFHKDTGENLVSVIHGKKFIVLIAPSDETNIKSKLSHDIEVQFDSNDFGSPIELHPAFSDCSKIYTTILTQGQSLFIPVGWIHYVHNIDTTISVSCWGKEMIM